MDGIKRVVIGILAHVDAGKTTLSEGMMYESGCIRKLGRVDTGNAFLDTFELERKRGITIFSKQAQLQIHDLSVTLLDTPGHVDFSADMERTLQVLDYAILVINGTDGIQGHTLTLWNLLNRYQIPVFIFVNKMDLETANSSRIVTEIKKRFSEGCIDFSKMEGATFYEQIAMCDEKLLASYLANSFIEENEIKRFIKERKIFPVFFGSALKLIGINWFLEKIYQLTIIPKYSDLFSARVFKIERDDSKQRLTYMKITGGSIAVKDILPGCNEKINQIRIYSGERYESVSVASAGGIYAITGPIQTYIGEGIGENEKTFIPILSPVLSYRINLPKECDASEFLPKLHQLEEEEPQLHAEFCNDKKEIQVQIMGDVQLEILQSIIYNRFHVHVEFESGQILYKETIRNTVEGVGHFEPLRHYAEVHLLLEPLPTGSGMEFATDCSEEVLNKNWQRLILTHLKEKTHKGVLTGSEITDIKVTLVAGRAHIKHTEGGDFRQSTYRAMRQGLMQAESILLEPYYKFNLKVPQSMIGRAMSDIEKMHGQFVPPIIEGDLSVLSGRAPVEQMHNYQKEFIAYSKGLGELTMEIDGYAPCHNQQEVIEKIHYDVKKDIENTPDSVFCAHGAGFIVNWDKVKDYMHVESVLKKETIQFYTSNNLKTNNADETIGLDEIDQIITQTFYANSSQKKKWKSKKLRDYLTTQYHSVKKKEKLKKYLLVDGYNIIYAWEQLRKIAEDNMDGARGRLLDIMCNYQSICQYELIVVFDAYRIKGHVTETQKYHNIDVVYTKEAQTADQYIEKFAHDNKDKYEIAVATSDGLEQIITRGQDCKLYSAREFETIVIEETKKVLQDYIYKNN